MPQLVAARRLRRLLAACGGCAAPVFPKSVLARACQRLAKGLVELDIGRALRADGEDRRRTRLDAEGWVAVGVDGRPSIQANSRQRRLFRRAPALISCAYMTGSFLVRAAVAADYEPVCALFAEVDELHRAHLPWLFRAPDDEPRSRELFEQQSRDASMAVFVAERQGLLGVATVLLRRAPEFALFIPQTWGVLDNIAVASLARRQGVGSGLTHAAEHWARSHGANWLELGVYEFNAGAREFYRALGYGPVLTKLRKPLGAKDGAG